jgi:hypothetical protein
VATITTSRMLSNSGTSFGPNPLDRVMHKGLMPNQSYPSKPDKWVVAKASRKSSCAGVTRFCACVKATDVRHNSEMLSPPARSAASSAD